MKLWGIEVVGKPQTAGLQLLRTWANWQPRRLASTDWFLGVVGFRAYIGFRVQEIWELRVCRVESFGFCGLIRFTVGLRAWCRVVPMQLHESWIRLTLTNSIDGNGKRN